jgi:hypothetical protein
MSLISLYSSSAFFRATMKTLVFSGAVLAGIFFASAGYGLLKMLLPALSGDATIGIAEFSTHSGLTIIFFGLAGVGAYVAKKCVW